LRAKYMAKWANILGLMYHEALPRWVFFFTASKLKNRMFKWPPAGSPPPKPPQMESATIKARIQIHHVAVILEAAEVITVIVPAASILRPFWGYLRPSTFRNQPPTSPPTTPGPSWEGGGGIIHADDRRRWFSLGPKRRSPPEGSAGDR